MVKEVCWTLKLKVTLLLKVDVKGASLRHDGVSLVVVLGRGQQQSQKMQGVLVVRFEFKSPLDAVESFVDL